jgi:hypothetical protein
VTLETPLQIALLLATPARLPAMRLFRRNIGVARMRGGHVVEFAIAGQCDLYAITRGGGHIEVELKSERGTLSKVQREWRDWCLEMSVPYLLLRAARGETIEQSVDRWCGELAEVARRMACAAPRMP